MLRIPTIGFISTWPIYQGTTIDGYAHSLIQGMSAAANEAGCRLLLGCGFNVMGNSPQRCSFWPVPGPELDFVPVGPWNTDGLIIVPDELTGAQLQVEKYRQPKAAAERLAGSDKKGSTRCLTSLTLPITPDAIYWSLQEPACF